MFRKIKEFFVKRKFKKMELKNKSFFCFSIWSEKNQPKNNESFNSYLERFMNAVKE